MKIPRQTATYIKENSCIEDVMAIANEILREYQPATGLNSRRNDAPPQRAKRQIGVH